MFGACTWLCGVGLLVSADFLSLGQRNVSVCARRQHCPTQQYETAGVAAPCKTLRWLNTTVHDAERAVASAAVAGPARSRSLPRPTWPIPARAPMHSSDRGRRSESYDGRLKRTPACAFRRLGLGVRNGAGSERQGQPLRESRDETHDAEEDAQRDSTSEGGQGRGYALSGGRVRRSAWDLNCHLLRG